MKWNSHTCCIWSLWSPTLPDLTFGDGLWVLVVLSEVIQAFSLPENAARMEEARESACNDMGKMLQLVLPVATQIQQEVIKAYGFNNEGEGKDLHTGPRQGFS